MKRTAAASLPLAFVLTACMHTPPPMEPENSEDDSSEKPHKHVEEVPDEGTGNMLAGGTPSSTMGEHATIKDDTVKKEGAKCGGPAIADLLSVIAQPSCEVPKATPESVPQKDLKDSLEIKVAADLPKVPPGSSAKITVTFHNKGKTALPLDFVTDPEPRFDLELYGLKGGRVDNPAGAEPAVPAGEPPERSISRVTIAPQGTATLVLPWNAVKYKWAGPDKAKGAVPGQHYPREVSGPLPKGKYVLKVVMPLVGVSEGVDHEFTQPRLPIEVGGI